MSDRAFASVVTYPSATLNVTPYRSSQGYAQMMLRQGVGMGHGGYGGYVYTASYTHGVLELSFVTGDVAQRL